MKKYIYLLSAVLFAVFFYTSSFYNSLYAQGTTCATATPFCTGSPVQYPAGVSNGNAPSGPNYLCLLSTPNPAWFYLQINQIGTIELSIGRSPARDIDFAIWGPFVPGTTPAEACNEIFTGNPRPVPADCSYVGGTGIETPEITATATGQIFILIVTNFSNQPTDLTITSTPVSTGTTDCAIVVNQCEVDLGPDIFLCATDLRPILNASRPSHDADTRYQWFVDNVSQGPASPTSTFQVQAHTPSLTSHNYKVRVSSVATGGTGCNPAEDDIEVTIKPDPAINLTVFPNDTTICSSTGNIARVVNSQVGISYQVLVNGSPSGGLVAGTGGTIQLPIAGLTSGISTMQIRARYTTAPNCSVTLTDQAQINFLGNIIVNLGADKVICETATTNFNGSHSSHPVNTIYQWKRSIDGGTTYTNIPLATSPTYTASETLPVPYLPFEVFYKLELTFPSSTCTYSDEVKVTYEPLPRADLTIEVDSVCGIGKGSIRIVNPQSGSRYRYQLRANNAGVAGLNLGVPQSSAAGAPIVFLTPTINTTTKYFIEVTNTLVPASSNCKTFLTIEPEVIVYPAPTAAFSGGANLCQGDDVELTVTMTGTQPFTITYRRDGEPGLTTINSINANTYSFFTDLAGVYRITSVQDFYCENISNSVTTTVNVNPIPQFTLGGDTTICDSQAPLVLTALNPTGFVSPSYKWFRDGVELVGETNSTLTTTESSTAFLDVTYEYILEVTNNETNVTNCESSDALLVTFRPSPEAEISFNGSVETGNTLQFCDSDGIQTLNGLSAGHTNFPSVTYQWTDLTTGTVVGNSATLDVDKFGETTTYELLVTNGVIPLCEDVAQITIEFIENPVAQISHNGTVVSTNGGGSGVLDFCFDQGIQVLEGVDASHAGLGSVTYEWNDLTNGVSLGNTAQIDISNPTNVFASIEYELIVRDESNPTICQSTTTIRVNFYPNPEAEISFNGNVETGNTLQFCDSDGVQTLDGTIPNLADVPTVTYQWTDLTTGTIVGTMPTLDVDKFGETTIYELLVSDNLPTSCERTAQITIEFIENPVAQISHNGTVVSTNGGGSGVLDFCFDQGIQVLEGVDASHAGLGSVTYEWNDLTNGVSLGNTAQIDISNPTNVFASIEYELIVRDESNPTICQSTTTIRVNFYPNPEAEISFNGNVETGNTLQFCDSDGVQTLDGTIPNLADVPTVTYQWTDLTTGTIVGTMPTLDVDKFGETTIYELLVSDNLPTSCERTAQITIEFIENPVAQISHNGTVVSTNGGGSGVLDFCFDQGIQVLEGVDASHAGLGSVTYEWNDLTNGVSLGNTAQIDISNSTNTPVSIDYELIVRDESNPTICQSTTTIRVNFYPNPEAEISFNGNVETGNTLQFCDSDGVQTLDGTIPNLADVPTVTYQWTDLTTGTVIGNSATLDVDKFGETTTYELLVSDNLPTSCERTAQITIEFIENPVAQISHNGTVVSTNGGGSGVLDFCFDQGIQVLEGVDASHAGLGSVTYEWNDLTNGVSLGNTAQIDISNSTNTPVSIDYELIVRDESNPTICQSTTTIRVNFYPNPEAEISFNGNVETGNTLQFCDSDGVQTLDGTIPNLADVPTVTYQWTDLTTGTVVGTMPTLDVDKFGETTTYELLVSDNLPTSCERTAQITIEFIENPVAQISHNGTVVSTNGGGSGVLDFCFDQGIQVLEGVDASHAGLGSVTYEWNDLTNGVSLGNTAQIDISNSTNTPVSIDYELIVRDESNPTICQSTTTIRVNFYPNPEAEISFNGNVETGNTLQFCDSDGVQTLDGTIPNLADVPTVTYQWTDLTTGTVIGNSATLDVDKFGETTTYELLVSDNLPTSCERTAQITIEFIENPVAQISHNGTVVSTNGGGSGVLDFCFDQGIQVLEGVDASHAGLGSVTYEWNDLTNGVSLGNTAQIDISNSTNTPVSIDYELIVRDESNPTICQSTTTIRVNFYPNPEAEISFNGNVETGNTLQFCDSDGIQTLNGLSAGHTNFPSVTYQWTDLTTGTVVGNSATLDVDKFGETTTYELLVTNGVIPLCEDVAQITIEFIENPVAQISHNGTVVSTNGGGSGVLDFCFDQGIQVLEGVDASHAGLGSVTYEWNDLTNGVSLGNTAQIDISNSTNTPVSIDYELIVRDESNPTICQSTTTIRVNFYPNPEAEISFNGNVETGNTLQFCDSDGVQTLDGTIPNLADVPTVTYQWTDLTTGTIVGTMPTLDVDKFGETTIYELLVSDNLPTSCERTAQITIEFIENPVAQISHNGTVVSTNGGGSGVLDFCFDQGIQVLEGVDASHAGLGSVTYEWNDLTNGVSLGNTAQIDISNPTNVFASIEYELIVRDESNPTICQSTTTIRVNFYPNPEAEISFNGNVETGNTLQFCDSDGVQTLDGTIPNLADVPTVTYQWTDLTTGTIVGTMPTLDVDKFGETTIYELLVSDNLPTSCERTAQITIEFIENPVAQISHNGTVVSTNGGGSGVLDFCFDQGIQVLEGVDASHAGLGSVTYEWNDLTNGVSLGNTAQIDISNSTNTPVSIDYELIVRDESNPTICQSTTTIRVNFYPNPEAEISFNGNVETGNTLQFCDSDGIQTLNGLSAGHTNFPSVTYQWTDLTTGTVVGNSATLDVDKFGETTTYELLVTNGVIPLCEDVAQITIEFIENPVAQISHNGTVVSTNGGGSGVLDFCFDQGIQVLEGVDASHAGLGSVTYEWNDLTNGVSLGNTAQIDISNSTNTPVSIDYELIVRDESNPTICQSTTTIRVNFYPNPEAEISFNGNVETGNTLQFCDSDGVQTLDGTIPNLADVPTVTYQWTDLTTGTIVGTMPTLDVDKFGETTIYELLVSDNLPTSCERTAQITIEFIENPVAQISHNGTVVSTNGGGSGVLDFCFDQGIQVLEGVDASHAGLGSVTYEWNDLTNGVSLGNTAQIDISNSTNTPVSIDYELIVRDESNPTICQSTTTIRVNFYPNPEAEISFNGNVETGNTLQFCDSDGVQTLDGTIPNLADVPTVTYQWTDLTTGTVVGTMPTLDVDKFGETTTYELLVSDNLPTSCERTAQITIEFIENPVAQISHNGTVVSTNGGGSGVLDFCFDQGIQVLEGVDASHAGLGSVTYEWNDLTNGVSLGNTAQIDISNSTNTPVSIDYELIVRDESNPTICQSTTTIRVNFYPNPEAEISFNGNVETGNTLQFCDSDGVQTLDGTIPNLADVPTVTYQWTDLTTGTVIGNSATLDVDKFGETTTYELLVSDNLPTSCERTAQITIEFIENPVAQISHNGTVVSTNGGGSGVLDFCFDQGIQVLEGVDASHAGLGSVTYEWNDLTNGVSLGNTAQIDISNSTNTPVSIDYELIVRDESNPTICQSTTTIRVNFYPNPEAEISFNGNVETGNTLQFCDSDGVQTLDGTIPNLADVPTVTYQWTDLTTGTVVGTMPTLDVDKFGETTTYELLVSDNLPTSCERTAQITIEFIENPVAQISHNGTVVSTNGGGSGVLDFCFDQGIQVLEGVDASHAGLGSVTYEWNDLTNGVSLGNTAQIDISNSTNTPVSIDYELIVRDESNPTICQSTTTIRVNFYPNPEAEISFNGNVETGNTLQFCDSDGVQTLDGTIPNLADVPTVTYQWTDLTTGTVVGTMPTLDVDKFGETTIYELLVSDNLPTSCERTAQITIEFIENPVAQISHNGTVVSTNGGGSGVLDFCFDQGIQVLEGVDASHAGLGSVTYEWNDLTNGVSLGNTAQIDISNPTNVFASIEYELIVRDESNPTICQSTTTIRVNFAESPVAEIQFNGSTASNSLVFCDSDGVRTLEGALPSHAAFGSVSYIWTQVGVGVVGNLSTFVTPVSNFSSTATYILEVISNDNPNLCSRTDEITIQFIPIPETDIRYAGNVVTELGFCTSEGTQVVTAPASPFYTYQWYSGTTANPTLTTLGTNQSQSVDNFAIQGGDTNTALYTVVVTDSRAACPAQNSVTVNFYAEPEIDESILVVSASPQTHCATGTSTISITNTEADVEYRLFKNGTAISGAVQTPTTDLSTITFDVTENTTLTTGQSRYEYSIQATRTGNFGRLCTQFLEDTATVIIYPEPTARVSGTATVCANEPTDVIFTITGNFPATLTYQVTDTLGNVTVETEVIGAVGSTSPQTFAVNTNTNEYIPLSITDRYCSGTVDNAPATVTTVHPPKVNWVAFDTAFCVDAQATFEVVGGIAHQYFINGLPVSASNPYVIQPNTLAVGTYEIYAKGFATPGGCSANSDTITFIVHPLPVVDLGVDRIKCVDDILPLVATQTGSFIYDWRRIKANGDIVTVGNGNDSLYVSLQGTYFVIVTNLATGCSDSSNVVSVTNYDTLDVDLGPDVYVCNPSSLPYRLIGSDISHQNGTTYEWYKDNNNATIIGTDSVYDATEEGIYRVTAIDPRGCKARDTIRVNFTADPDFQIIGHDDYECGEQDTLRIEATNLRNMIIDWQGNGIVSLSDSNRRAIVDVSGIYTIIVTDTSTIANCSTIKSVEVFVRPKISLVLPNTGTGDTTTLCQGDSLILNAFDPIHDDNYQYRWKWLEGNQIIATTPKVKITYAISESFTSQRFEVRVTDPNGECFSTDTVNVRFRRKPIARINASDSVICLGESITLQGGESLGNQFEWIRLPETASFAITESIIVTPDSVGDFVYVLKAYFDSSTPCGAIADTIKIRVNRRAVANIEQDEIRLCENEQLEIDAFLPENPALTRYIWTHEENNLVLSTDSVLNVSFTEIQPVSYEPFHIVLTVYDSLTGCDSTDRVLVKFNRASKITIDSTYRRKVCLGDSVSLRARGATSYSWRRLGDTTNTILDSTSQITVRLDTVGFHTFIVTGGYENECQNTGDTAIIFVNPLPTIKAHRVDTVSICANDSITLYPSGGKSYVWLNDPTAFDTIMVSPKVPTNYIVVGTDSNGCQNIDTVHVYVSPTFELPELLQVCENETVTIGDSLNFADSSANVRATYFWTPTGETTPFINVGVSGTYTVEVMIDDCSFTRTAEVQVKPKPKLELVSDTTLCFELGVEDRFERGQTHILRSQLLNRDSTTTYLYVWTDSTGQYLGNRDSLEIEAGRNYRLRVIARYDTECETNDSTFVTELCQPRIFVPEAFTPNGDNLNDNFEVFGKHIKNFEMQIFSRWSDVMFEVRAKDLEELQTQNFWDGTFNGKNVPTGVYIWIIRYTDPFSGSTKQVQKTGSLMLVR